VKLSVVIPCLNEEKFIAGILGDLESQIQPDMEVIVVDSESTDGTVAAANAFAGRLPIRVIQGKRGVANARNLGAEQASGEWIFFFDADLRVPHDFITKALAELERRSLDIASAASRTNTHHPLDRFGSMVIYWYGRLLERSNHPVAGGFCILARRELHQKIGGFDPTLKLAEDHDYVARAVAARARFRFLHSVYVIFSMRRFVQQGRLKTLKLWINSEIYMRTHKGRVDKDFGYEFGGFGGDDKQK
jgi:glycosyltransferase involved in cell wall biosynthesis